ncbi:MAG: hypothetical protein WKF77_26170 [Planctomycetaceae bacterium]
MVGKPVPPKPVPPKTSPTPESAPREATPKEAATYTIASPPIIQGAAAAAAGTALKATGRNESSGPQSPASRLNKSIPGRLVSLDAFRGFIMMMLAATGFGIAGFAAIDDSSAVWQVHNHESWKKLAWHFEHPAWRSAFDYYKVSFWDLIQPAFMFMVGVAMPFSYARRSHHDHSFLRRALHSLMRSVALMLIGVFLQSRGKEHTTWEFPNVLCQIGLGYFFAWCLLNFKPIVQGVALVVILIGYWALFFFNPPPADYDYASVSASAKEGEVFEGRFAAWSRNANAAFFFDRWLLPKLRTVPEPDAQPAEGAAAVPRDSDWRPVALTQLQDAGTKEPGETSADVVQPPAQDNPAVPVPAADGAATGASGIESAKTVAPVTDSTTETVPPVPPAGPGWFRRAFLHNDVPWKPNTGGYATLNFVPSIGTTLLGMLCGQLLLAGGYSHWKKLGILIVAAGICLGLGILADMYACPIVKRIWTPSWVLFSGGYVIGMLALFYLFFDIAPLKFLAFPLVVVGMNSILTYLLGNTLGGWTQKSLIGVHFAGLIDAIFGPKALDPQWYAPITLATGTFVVFWLFLYWLHRQKIYLRL